MASSAVDSAFASRAKGAVLGNIVGDAAAVPNHWVYDPDKMEAHVKAAKRGPAFCDPPGNSFYYTDPGELSCYADQTMCLLESLVASQGFDEADYAARLAKMFGRESSYELDATDPDNWPQLKQNPKDAEGKIIDSKRVWRMPLDGPWRHGSIKGFLTNYVDKNLGPGKSGSDDKQVDGCCKVPPLVALYAGDAALLPTVERAVRVTQDTDEAVAYACAFARILESLVTGAAATVAEACEQAKVALSDPARTFSTAMDEEVKVALELASKLADVPRKDVGAKVQEALNLPRSSTALA